LNLRDSAWKSDPIAITATISFIAGGAFIFNARLQNERYRNIFWKMRSAT
jgi:hypothetical protein